MGLDWDGARRVFTVLKFGSGPSNRSFLKTVSISIARRRYTPNSNKLEMQELPAFFGRFGTLYDRWDGNISHELWLILSTGAEPQLSVHHPEENPCQSDYSEQFSMPSTNVHGYIQRREGMQRLFETIT
jgi:hypothetical protein